MKNILSIAALAAIMSAGVAHAGVNLVHDGNFSQDGICCGPFDTSDAYWQNAGHSDDTLHGVYNNYGLFSGFNLALTDVSPKQSATYYYSDGGVNYQSVYIYQAISGLTVGQKYTLTFNDAVANEGGNAAGVAGWEVNFGGTQVAGTSFPSDGVTQTTQHAVGALGSGWFQESMTFTANASIEDLAFKAIGAGAPPFALLTDVSLTSAAPEPATWAMLIAGFLAVGFAARRRRAVPA